MRLVTLHVGDDGDLGLLNINYAGTITERAVLSSNDQSHGLWPQVPAAALIMISADNP